jgi:hypothetical protein
VKRNRNVPSGLHIFDFQVSIRRESREQEQKINLSQKVNTVKTIVIKFQTSGLVFFIEEELN